MAAYGIRTQTTTPAAETTATGGNHAMGTNQAASLKGKPGDAFDAVFIGEMIVRHQGAIKMAEAAPTRAKHQEGKELATAIIAAQTSETTTMHDWQQAWGSTDGGSPFDHDMPGM